VDSFGSDKGSAESDKGTGDCGDFPFPEGEAVRESTDSPSMDSDAGSGTDRANSPDGQVRHDHADDNGGTEKRTDDSLVAKV